MYVLGDRLQPELVGVLNIPAQDHGLGLLDDKVDRLDRPCRLFREHDAKTLGAAHLVPDAVDPEIPDREAGCDDRDHDGHTAAQR